jgi:hypothetical protein
VTNTGVNADFKELGTLKGLGVATWNVTSVVSKQGMLKEELNIRNSSIGNTDQKQPRSHKNKEFTVTYLEMC